MPSTGSVNGVPQAPPGYYGKQRRKRLRRRKRRLKRNKTPDQMPHGAPPGFFGDPDHRALDS